jgi:hypothetical protein
MIAGGSLKTANDADVLAFKWAPDGKSIFCARNQDDVGNIWSARLDGAHPKKLTDFSPTKSSLSTFHLIIALLFPGDDCFSPHPLENVK